MRIFRTVGLLFKAWVLVIYQYLPAKTFTRETVLSETWLPANTEKNNKFDNFASIKTKSIAVTGSKSPHETTQ